MKAAVFHAPDCGRRGRADPDHRRRRAADPGPGGLDLRHRPADLPARPLQDPGRAAPGAGPRDRRRGRRRSAREVTGYARGRPGQRSRPTSAAGTAEFCRQGLNNMCPDYEAFGISLDGGFAGIPAGSRASRVQRGNVFQLPDRVTYAEAALVEPFSCCLRGQEALGVGYEDTVLIVGAGPIGAFNVMLARLAGARKIIVANRSQPRLDAAKRARRRRADQCPASRTWPRSCWRETDGAGRRCGDHLRCPAPRCRPTAVRAARHPRPAELLRRPRGRRGRCRIDTNRVHYKGLTLTGTTGIAATPTTPRRCDWSATAGSTCPALVSRDVRYRGYRRCLRATRRPAPG